VAEDLRGVDPNSQRDVTEAARRVEIKSECLRQSENCLWTSTIFYIWLRQLRWHHRLYIGAPILFGALASAAVVKSELPAFAAVMAFAAGVVPAVAEAWKLQAHVDEVSRLAAEYKALQDRFRRAANITTIGDVTKAEGVLEELMSRVDLARSSSLTPPEWCFQEASKKINKGNYAHEVDANS
jgi:hypothetical protein